MRVDTHIHSRYSDGTYLPVEIAERARKENLDLIALTDHNTVEGIQSFASCARHYGLKALAGMEITTEYRRREIHLLAYFPLETDFRSEKLSPLMAVLDRIRDRKVASNMETIENLAGDFPQVSWDGFIGSVRRTNRTGGNYNRMHIASYLAELGIVADARGALKGMLSEKGKYYSAPEREDLLETVRTVVGCGGFPTIAHMVEYQPDLSDGDLEDMLRDISGITREFGVEIFHFNHRPEHIAKYQAICGRVDADILRMAGSDCHGLKKPNRIGHPYDFDLDAGHAGLLDEVSGSVVDYFRGRKWI